MGHDTDGSSSLAQRVQDGDHLLEALVVEGAEALVDEEGAEVEAAGLLAHGVGEPEGQGQGGHERLAARQGRGLTAHARPLVEDAQAQTAAGALGGQAVGVLEPVAAVAHDPQPLVGELGDLLEPGREDVGGEPHPQRVVEPCPAEGVGQLLDPAVTLERRTRRVEGAEQAGADRDEGGPGARGPGLEGLGRKEGVARVLRRGREAVEVGLRCGPRRTDLGVGEDGLGGGARSVVVVQPVPEPVEGGGRAHRGGGVVERVEPRLGGRRRGRRLGEGEARCRGAVERDGVTPGLDR